MRYAMSKKIVLYSCIVVAVFVARISYVHAATDTDGDGLSDSDETTMYFTDPLKVDTDGDGFTDGDEVARGYSPRFGGKKKMIEVDSDKDYLNDDWEIKLGTGLMNPDSDGDKFLDGTEVAAGYDPLNPELVQKEKKINVNIKQQHLEYRFGDTNLGSFPISGGLPGTPTPLGDFTILDKVPVKHYGGPGYDLPNTKWNLHFTTRTYGYYIHGAYWHHDFGKPKSHGCVNVSYANMEPLYWFAQVGTPVHIE